jgi:hypothetical protein
VLGLEGPVVANLVQAGRFLGRIDPSPSSLQFQVYTRYASYGRLCILPTEGSVLYGGRVLFSVVVSFKFVYVCFSLTRTCYNLDLDNACCTCRIMHPEYNLYHGSNLSTFRDPSPNLVLGSYYPEINDSGVHSSESSERHGSRLAWDSFEVKVCFSFIYKHYIKHYLLLSKVKFRPPALDPDSALQQQARRKIIQLFYRLTIN